MDSGSLLVCSFLKKKNCNKNKLKYAHGISEICDAKNSGPTTLEFSRGLLLVYHVLTFDRYCVRPNSGRIEFGKQVEAQRTEDPSRMLGIIIVSYTVFIPCTSDEGRSPGRLQVPR